MSGRRPLSRTPPSAQWGVAAAVGQKILSAVTILMLLSVFARVLDADAYGLVALYVSVQIVLTVFDFGISTSATRDFALDKKSHSWRGLLTAYEVWIWVLAALLLLLAAVASRAMVGEVEKPGLQMSAAVLALALALELPSRLYLGVLLGRQRQLISAVLLAVGDLSRWLGGVVWVVVTGQVTMFFLWHAAVLLFWIGLLRTHALRLLPIRPREEPLRRMVARLGRYTLAPLALATIAGGVRLYADRIYASQVLSLAVLGAYTTALALSGALALLSTQICSALIPRLARLEDMGHPDRAHKLFLRVHLVVAAFTSVLALMLVLSRNLIAQLLGLEGLRAEVFVAVLPVAVLAGGLASLGGPAYSWVVARGRFQLVAFCNVAGAVVVIAGLEVRPQGPASIAAVGALGAALVVLLLSSSLWSGWGGSLSARQAVTWQAMSILWVAVCTPYLLMLR